MIRVAEVYQSIQGEGLLAGTPSVFLRTSGCNLRCQFCDTPFASWQPEGPSISVEQACADVFAYDCRHVVLTGGEPMMFPELVALTERLRQAGKHITIETAGTLWLPVHCDLMSISPKLSNSTPSVSAKSPPAWVERHEATRHAPEVIRRLTEQFAFQLKFVIATPDDVAEVLLYLEEFPELSRDRILLMPEGVDQQRLADIGTWLEPLCKDHGFRFCPRLQIEWFGATRQT